MNFCHAFDFEHPLLQILAFEDNHHIWCSIVPTNAWYHLKAKTIFSNILKKSAWVFWGIFKKIDCLPNYWLKLCHLGLIYIHIFDITQPSLDQSC